MANPNRTSYSGPPLSGPGIMWVNSTPKPPLSDEIFNKWYQDIHIPDIVRAKPGDTGCPAAWRFKCQNKGRLRPYLALYSVSDMSFIQSQEFARISQYHNILPEGGPSQRFVDFDTRFYRRLNVYEKLGGSAVNGIGKVVKSTAIQPAPGTEEEFSM